MYLLPAPQIAGLLPAPKAIDFQTIIREAFPDDGGFWSGVFRSLGSVEDAEALIEEYMRHYPARAPHLWDSFMLICPPDWMRDEWDREHHQRELLERVAKDHDLAPPTEVEVAHFMIAVVMKEADNPPEVIPPAREIITRLRAQPPYKIRMVYEQMCPQERHQPDPQRWHDRVALEKKRAIFDGIDVPAELLTPAEYERDDHAIMKAS